MRFDNGDNNARGRLDPKQLLAHKMKNTTISFIYANTDHERWTMWTTFS